MRDIQDLPAWHAGCNGGGKRTWFVLRGQGFILDDGTPTYHCDKNGDLIRYKTHEAAAKVALKLNEAEGRVTRVIFRRWYKQQDGSGVIALFPDISERRPGIVSSFEHIGQHGAADLAGVISRTKPVDVDNEPDAFALKRELEKPPYSYLFKVIQRSPH